MLGRIIAVAIAFMLLIGFIAWSQMMLEEKFSKYMPKTSTTTKENKYKQYLDTIRDVASYKLPIALASVLIPLIIARKLIARRRLLGTISVKDFQKHVLLFGPTGSGKTSTALKAIELSLKNDTPVEVIDWKGEYSEKIHGATIIRKIRLLEPLDWSNVENHAMVVVDILRDVLQLTEPMAYMLYEELSKMYEEKKASFNILLQQLKTRRAIAIAQRFQAEANIAEGLIRRILPLVLDERREAVNMNGDGRVKIYDLSELPTYQLKTLYAEIILWRLFNEALKDRSHRLKKIVVAEESQNYVRPRRIETQPSIGERIVNELRAYGYGFILISPDPSQLPYHMVRDCGAVVSIGYQALPDIIVDLLNNYRYADIKKLIKTTGKPRTYIYYNGRLHIKKIPKPYKKKISLGVQAVPEIAREVEEETVEKKPIILKAEEEAGPIDGAVRDDEDPSPQHPTSLNNIHPDG